MQRKLLGALTREARSYEEYVDDKKSRGEKPQSKEDWEKHQGGKDEGKKDEGKGKKDEGKSNVSREEVKSTVSYLRGKFRGDKSEAYGSLGSISDMLMDPALIEASQERTKKNRSNFHLDAKLGKELAALLKENETLGLSMEGLRSPYHGKSTEEHTKALDEFSEKAARYDADDIVSLVKKIKDGLGASRKDAEKLADQKLEVLEAVATEAEDLHPNWKRKDIDE